MENRSDHTLLILLALAVALLWWRSERRRRQRARATSLGGAIDTSPPMGGGPSIAVARLQTPKLAPPTKLVMIRAPEPFTESTING